MVRKLARELKFIVNGGTNTIYGGSGTNMFQFGSKGWNVTIYDIANQDFLDFSGYQGDYGAVMSQSGNNLKLKYVQYNGDSETKMGMITLQDYFTNQVSGFQFIGYNPNTQKKQTVNVIAGGNNANNIVGTSGNDWIISGNGNKTVNAGKGNDLIQVGWGDLGSKGKQIINAGAGNDEIYADGGTNTLNGGSGNDIIFVENTEKNILNGGSGNDTLEVYGKGHVLNGGTGDDILIIHSGNDNQIFGGAGKDIFHFTKEACGSSIVNDYEVGIDIIRFDSGVSIVGSSVSQNDVTLNLSIGGTINVLGAVGKKITFENGNEKQTTRIFA